MDLDKKTAVVMAVRLADAMYTLRALDRAITDTEQILHIPDDEGCRTELRRALLRTRQAIEHTRGHLAGQQLELVRESGPRVAAVAATE